MVPATRARLGLAHAIAWVANGLAAASLVTDAVRHDGAPAPLALGASAALAAAALGLLAPRRVRPRTLAIIAAAVAVVALAAAGAMAMLELPVAATGAAGMRMAAPPVTGPIGLLPVALLGLAAGLQLRATHAAAAADAPLAPRVRPAPTLLAAATGTAAAAALPALDAAVLLLVAAGLHLVVLALLAAARPADGPATTADERPMQAPPAGAPQPDAPARALPPTALGLLALAAAGAAAIAALRPALSALGTDDPQPAWPAALTLALGALLGPPLARVAARLLPVHAVAAVATLGGVAALAAPVARPGTLDAIVAGLLGIALAASVGLAELGRRADVRPAPAAPAIFALAAAGGAALSALLLAAVPVADVVLGAAIACLVAALGAWAPRRARVPVG